MSISDCHIIRVDKFDIGNGNGIGVLVWTAGCTHQCEGCHNPETWKWHQGVELTQQRIDKILDACDNPVIERLTITGGDPLFVKNREGVAELAKQFKARFGNSKSLWLWTGYLFDDVKDLEVIKYLDVIVDGKYVQELKDVTLPYCGSSNQRVLRLVDGKVIGEIKDQNSPLLP